MAESKIERKSVDHLRAHGWLVLKYGVDGWPDDYCWHPLQKRTVWLEFKDYSKDPINKGLQEHRLNKIRNVWKCEAYACNSFQSMIDQLKNI
jgi:hypothetical protein